MLRFESLHNHTIDTDGSQTHLDLLHSAERHGIGVMAFTDHDVLPTAETLEQLSAYRGPVKWLVGIELSSGVTEELGGAANGNLHVLGFFTDPTNQALVDHCEELTKSRIERMRRMVKRFNELGLKVTEDDIITAAGGGRNIGYPHMVTAILNNPENRAVIERMMAEFKAEADKNEDLAPFYRRTVAEGPKQYPYALFLKKHSFYPMPQEAINGLPDFDISVRLIREAGGVALLAHPYFNQSALPYEELQKLVEAKRLDGIETEVVNKITVRDVRADVEILQRMARAGGLLQSVGSDAHSDEDLAAFAESEAAQRSIGQTQKIIEAVSPDLSWSNLG